MSKRFVGLAAILAFASGAALAQDDGSMSQPPSGGGQQPTFNQLDSNSDGTISQDEAKADPQLEQDFAQADKNGDGTVDQSEFSAFEEQMGQQPPSGGSSGGSSGGMSSSPSGS